jgi:hypothetical protein
MYRSTAVSGLPCIRLHIASVIFLHNELNAKKVQIFQKARAFRNRDCVTGIVRGATDRTSGESWFDSREKKETFLLSKVARLALGPNLVDGHRALFSKGAEWPESGNDHSPNLVSS